MNIKSINGFTFINMFKFVKFSVNIISNMKLLLDEWSNKEYYGSDEEFLSKIIYPLLKPVCYYEPRLENKSVIINHDFETYVKLETNYKLVKYTN